MTKLEIHLGKAAKHHGDDDDDNTQHCSGVRRSYTHASCVKKPPVEGIDAGMDLPVPGMMYHAELVSDMFCSVWPVVASSKCAPDMSNATEAQHCSQHTQPENNGDWELDYGVSPICQRPCGTCACVHV